MLLCIGLAIPELTHINSGESKPVGSVRDGKIENACLVPFRGKNFAYASPLSYFAMNNAYTTDRVYNCMMVAYDKCAVQFPKRKFYLLETSDKNGGKLLAHRTHQNGLSVDFLTPLKDQKENPVTVYSALGLFHYLLEFDHNGKLKFNQKTEIDFDAMAFHLIELNKATKQNGLRIHKVIFHKELLPELLASKYGKKLQDQNIFFVRSNWELLNQYHDDHYHVDFEYVN